MFKEGQSVQFVTSRGKKVVGTVSHLYRCAKKGEVATVKGAEVWSYISLTRLTPVGA